MAERNYISAKAANQKCYNDFESIDWMVDQSKARIRTRFLRDYFKQANLFAKFKVFFSIISAWMIIFFIGTFGAITSRFVTLGVHYLSDVREGICNVNMLYKKSDCCWASSSQYVHGQIAHVNCDEWLSWGQLIGGFKDSYIEYFINYLVYTIISLLYVSFSYFVVKVLAPFAAGGGIAEIKTIMGGFILHGYLGIVTFIVKAVTLIPTVASGLILGQEAPMVHICTCIANIIARFDNFYKFNEAKRREILAAGAACGVSIAFGAPVGGLLFSFEEICMYFETSTIWRTFFGTLIGSLFLVLLDPYFNGHIVLYLIEHITQWKMFEVLPFIFLGICGGMYGAAFTYLTVLWNRNKGNIKYLQNPYTLLVVVCLVTAVLSFPSEYTRISNHHLLDSLFLNCGKGKLGGGVLCNLIRIHQKQYTLYEQLIGLSVAFLLKSVLMIFTNGLKIPCGLFVPTITIGACAGKIIGLLLEHMFKNYPNTFIFNSCLSTSDPCILPSTYAVIGAAAFLAGVTQMTVALVVIFIEITGQMSFIIPLMVAVLIAKLISSFFVENLYHLSIENLKYPYLSSADKIRLDDLVKDVMNPRSQSVNTTESVVDDLCPGSVNSLLLTPDENINISSDLSNALGVVSGVNSTKLVILSATGLKLKDIVKIIRKYNYRGFPVVNNKDEMRLHGYVTRKDLVIVLTSIFTKHGDYAEDTYADFTQIEQESEFANHDESSFGLYHVLQKSPIQVSPISSMELVYELFYSLGLRMLMVVSKGKLIGIISKKDLITYIHSKSH